MPRLVRLYIDNVLTGFAVAIVFVVALVLLDVGNLGRLMLGSGQMWIAVAMLVVPFGTLFGSAQFAFAVMRMADTPRRDEDL